MSRRRRLKKLDEEEGYYDFNSREEQEEYEKNEETLQAAKAEFEQELQQRRRHLEETKKRCREEEKEKGSSSRRLRKLHETAEECDQLRKEQEEVEKLVQELFERERPRKRILLEEDESDEQSGTHKNEPAVIITVDDAAKRPKSEKQEQSSAAAVIADQMKEGEEAIEKWEQRQALLGTRQEVTDGDIEEYQEFQRQRRSIKKAEYEKAWNHYRKTIESDLILSKFAPYALLPIKERAVANYWGTDDINAPWLFSRKEALLPLYIPAVPRPNCFSITVMVDPNSNTAKVEQHLVISARKGDLVPVYVLIHNTAWSSSHANALLLDFKSKLAYHFEPHGHTSLDISYDLIFEALRKSLPAEIEEIRGMPAERENGQGLESRSELFENYLQMGKRGKCAVWCLMFFHGIQLGFPPPQIIEAFGKLEPNDAVLLARSFTSEIMGELYDGASPLRAALPKPWPTYLTRIIEPERAEKTVRIVVKEPEEREEAKLGKGSRLTGTVREEPTKARHPAAAKEPRTKTKEREEGAKTTIRTYWVPRKTPHLPKSDFHLARLMISLEQWIKLTSQEYVDKQLEEYDYDPDKLQIFTTVPILKTEEKIKTLGEILEKLRAQVERFILSAGKKLDVKEYRICFASEFPADKPAFAKLTLLQLEETKVHGTSKAHVYDFHLRAGIAPFYWGRADFWTRKKFNKADYHALEQVKRRASQPFLPKNHGGRAVLRTEYPDTDKNFKLKGKERYEDVMMLVLSRQLEHGEQLPTNLLPGLYILWRDMTFSNLTDAAAHTDFLLTTYKKELASYGKETHKMFLPASPYVHITLTNPKTTTDDVFHFILLVSIYMELHTPLGYLKIQASADLRKSPATHRTWNGTTDVSPRLVDKDGFVMTLLRSPWSRVVKTPSGRFVSLQSYVSQMQASLENHAKTSRPAVLIRIDAKQRPKPTKKMRADFDYIFDLQIAP